MYKVIIVDDEPIICHGIKLLIDWSSYSFTVQDCAHNGKEAMEKIQSNDYDLVIVDICMPVTDGIALIKQMKEKKNTKQNCSNKRI